MGRDYHRCPVCNSASSPYTQPQKQGLVQYSTKVEETYPGNSNINSNSKHNHIRNDDCISPQMKQAAFFFDFDGNQTYIK